MEMYDDIESYLNGKLKDAIWERDQLNKLIPRIEAAIQGFKDGEPVGIDFKREPRPVNNQPIVKAPSSEPTSEEVGEHFGKVQQELNDLETPPLESDPEREGHSMLKVGAHYFPKDMTSIRFLDTLSDLRKSAGLSQPQLALKVSDKFHFTSISQMERGLAGRTKQSQDNVKKLADYFGVRISQWIFNQGQNNVPKPRAHKPSVDPVKPVDHNKYPHHPKAKSREERAKEEEV